MCRFRHTAEEAEGSQKEKRTLFWTAFVDQLGKLGPAQNTLSRDWGMELKVYSGQLCKAAGRRIPSVDIAKFVCALLVVTIHTGPLASYSSLANFELKDCIARVAVPFFFVASGYFLFRKMSEGNFDKGVALRYAARIFRLYVIWTVVYSPLIVKSILSNEGGGVQGTRRLGGQKLSSHRQLLAALVPQRHGVCGPAADGVLLGGRPA